MYRQGDVLIEPLAAGESIPAKATEVPRDAGRVILAYGEVTGHAHAISDDNAILMALGEDRFLKVEKQVTLSHEEHDPIVLYDGTYRITRQREYHPEAIRNVND
jgi:hypothetical protein